VYIWKETHKRGLYICKYIYTYKRYKSWRDDEFKKRRMYMQRDPQKRPIYMHIYPHKYATRHEETMNSNRDAHIWKETHKKDLYTCKYIHTKMPHVKKRRWIQIETCIYEKRPTKKIYIHANIYTQKYLSLRRDDGLKMMIWGDCD